MRHERNIFKQKRCRETGIRIMTSVTFTRIICSVLSGVVALGIIANFGEVTARIAIFMANLLSSGFLVLAVVIVMIYFVVQLKWKMRRKFWGW